MLEEIQSSTKVYNTYFVNDIKDPYTDKAYEKSCLVKHTYNDKKKNLMLIHSSKILGVSQDIGLALLLLFETMTMTTSGFTYGISSRHILKLPQTLIRTSTSGHSSS